MSEQGGGDKSEDSSSESESSSSSSSSSKASSPSSPPRVDDSPLQKCMDRNKQCTFVETKEVFYISLVIPSIISVSPCFITSFRFPPFETL